MGVAVKAVVILTGTETITTMKMAMIRPWAMVMMVVSAAVAVRPEVAQHHVVSPLRCASAKRKWRLPLQVTRLDPLLVLAQVVSLLHKLSMRVPIQFDRKYLRSN